MADDNTNSGLGAQTITEVTELDVEVEDVGNTDVEDSGNIDIADSGNDNSTDNSVENEAEESFNTDVENEESFNTDNSVENEAEESFNDNSTDLDVDLEVEIEDSFNDNSDNSINTEFEDSFNEDDSVRNTDSFNVTSSFNTQTLNDHSTSIGIRQYDTGFGDLNLGGLGGMAAAGKSYGHGGGGGDVDIDIDNRSLQLDQSVNQLINTGDGGGYVHQEFSQEANVAFGDGSIAAGGDVTVVDTTFDIEMGDISIGNTWIDTRINDSFQDNSVSNEWEMEVDIEDSFNDESETTNLDVDIEDSFTSEVDATFENSWEWENEGNIFSPAAATTGGEVETELEF